MDQGSYDAVNCSQKLADDGMGKQTDIDCGIVFACCSHGQ